jgi:hypothetical protein
VAEGTNLIVTPTEGNRVSKLFIAYDDEEKDLSSNEDGYYTFTMPAYNTTVTVIFENEDK